MTCEHEWIHRGASGGGGRRGVEFLECRKCTASKIEYEERRNVPIPIDDAMCLRALLISDAGKIAIREPDVEWMRRVLQAALNPKPPEPEIPVTDEMIEAGQSEWAHSLRVKTPGHAFANVFRAMAKVAPK